MKDSVQAPVKHSHNCSKAANGCRTWNCPLGRKSPLLADASGRDRARHGSLAATWRVPGEAGPSPCSRTFREGAPSEGSMMVRWI